MYVIECELCHEENQVHDKMKNHTVRCSLCGKVIQIGDTKKTVIKNVNRINKLETKNHYVKHVMQKTDYTFDGFIRGIHKNLHHWFVFYITAIVILGSIFIPLIILALIGNTVG